jgi:hypothetical protein
MATKKLTLSAPEEIIADVKKLAARKNTSVSALFVRLVRAVSREPKSEAAIGPITSRATGLIELPEGRNDKELLEDALETRYGAAK